MSRFVKIVLAGNLIVLAILAFVYPHLMLAPGKLIPGHRQLDADCFACHAALMGADSERCIGCHKPADIGRLTTLGQPVAKPLTTTPFHQQLVSQDCVACHSDHAGVKRFRSSGRFDHALLKKETLGQCQTCHKAPGDALHQQISGNCQQCHSQDKWVPASFDHGKYFVLDRDHNTRCVTCHTNNDYRRYTCYGCHEHTPAKIRREHIEEGIRNFEQCVECHRSADKDQIKGDGGEREDKRRDRREGKHSRQADDD